MLCCKKKPKERPMVSGPIAGTGTTNFSFEPDHGSDTLNNNRNKTSYDVQLPTKKPGNAVKVEAQKKADQDAAPQLPPRPDIPKRNPNAKILPPALERANSPTAVVKPSIVEPKPPLSDNQNKGNQFAEIREAIAIRDYDGTEIDELSFKKGDLLEVVVISHKTHWDGRKKATDEQGVVNANHVTLKPLPVASQVSSESQDKKKPWFKGIITKKIAEKLLMSDKSGKGSFLVREDENRPIFVLGVRGEESNICNNYEIKKTKDGKFFIFDDNSFDNLDALVNFYTESKGGLANTLTRPVGAPEETIKEEKPFMDESSIIPEEEQEEYHGSCSSEEDYETTSGRKGSVHDYDIGSQRGSQKQNPDEQLTSINLNSTSKEDPEETIDDADDSSEVYEELPYEETDYYTVEALFDYEAKNDDEMTISKGETLHVIDQKELWWHARRPGTTIEGFIPSNFVTEPDILTKYPWYFKELTGDGTDKLIMKEGNERGTFLVRKSATQEGRYTISLLDIDKIGKRICRHVRVCNNDDKVYIYKGKEFSSLPELVDYYTGNDETEFPMLRYCPKEP